MSILKRAFVLLVLVPSLAAGVTVTRTIVDPGALGSLHISDSVSAHIIGVVQHANMSDGVSLSDPPWLKLNLYVPYGDLTTISDSIAASAHITFYGEPLADGEGLADAIVATKTASVLNSATASDSVALADAIAAHGTQHFSGSPSDGVALADAIVASVHTPTLYTASMSDSVALADAITTSVRGPSAMSDGVGLADSIAATNQGARPKKRVTVIE